MRQFVVLAILAGFGATSGAEVIRCADAAGRVSYTDNACPAGARRVATVAIQEAATLTPEEIAQQRQARIDMADDRARESQRESQQAYARQAQMPSEPGIGIIDPSASSQNGGYDSQGFDDSYGYASPGVGVAPRPPRDMRPRIRKCDAKGCVDTLGNHYDRTGQLTRYQSISGQTCRPVGSTVICR
ncbi:MAG TPA: DUF4124 domain-containing protein [Variovorax sp.]